MTGIIRFWLLNLFSKNYCNWVTCLPKVVAWGAWWSRSLRCSGLRNLLLDIGAGVAVSLSPNFHIFPGKSLTFKPTTVHSKSSAPYASSSSSSDHHHHPNHPGGILSFLVISPGRMKILTIFFLNSTAVTSFIHSISWYVVWLKFIDPPKTIIDDQYSEKNLPQSV